MTQLQQEWADKLSAWRNSGLSMAAWCRAHDESYDRFVYWHRRLEPKLQKSGRFVELTIRPAALVLSCNGITLQLEAGFDQALLRDVLLVLKTV
jgi:hypothetical protein